MLGYRYRSPGIINDEAGDPPAFSVTQYLPCAYPGSLAPHAWLSDGTSLYDHFSDGFTLLRLGGKNTAGEAALLKAAEETGLPVSLFEPADEGLRALYEADYALIRPDQHVAWRGDEIVEARTLIDRIRGSFGSDRNEEIAARTAEKGRG